MLTTETKPAILSTEFWVVLFTNVVGFLQLFGVNVVDLGAEGVGNRYVLAVIAVVNGLYAIGRGIAKSSVAYTPPEK